MSDNTLKSLKGINWKQSWLDSKKSQTYYTCGGQLMVLILCWLKNQMQKKFLMIITIAIIHTLCFYREFVTINGKFSMYVCILLVVAMMQHILGCLLYLAQDAQ